jgi:hypothetical protein
MRTVPWERRERAEKKSKGMVQMHDVTVTGDYAFYDLRK